MRSFSFLPHLGHFSSDRRERPRALSFFACGERDPRLARDHLVERAVAVAREGLVEFGERLASRELALLDLVQRLLHPRRVGGLEEVVEVRDQQLDDRAAERGRDEAAVLLVDVPPLLDLAQDLGVGGGTADAVLLQELDERGLVEPRRRLRLLLLGRDLEQLEASRPGVSGGSFGESLSVSSSSSVGDAVGREVARELQRRARGAVDRPCPRRDLGRRRVVDRRAHLRGDEALPDQPVELRLVGRDVAARPPRAAGPGTSGRIASCASCASLRLLK